MLYVAPAEQGPVSEPVAIGCVELGSGCRSDGYPPGFPEPEAFVLAGDIKRLTCHSPAAAEAGDPGAGPQVRRTDLAGLQAVASKLYLTPDATGSRRPKAECAHAEFIRPILVRASCKNHRDGFGRGAETYASTRFLWTSGNTL